MKEIPIWLKTTVLAAISLAVMGVIYQRQQEKNELSQLIGSKILGGERLSSPIALPPLYDMQNRPFALTDLDRPVLLHFWATWCPSCIKEISSITNLAATFNDKLQVITVNVDSSPIMLDKFLQDNRYTLPLLRSQMPQSDLPVTFLLNKNGVAYYRFTGAKPWASPHAAEQLNYLIKELP